jgi:hypothetical protein
MPLGIMINNKFQSEINIFTPMFHLNFEELLIFYISMAALTLFPTNLFHKVFIVPTMI